MSLARSQTTAEERNKARDILVVGVEVAWFHQVQQDLLRLHPHWTCVYASDCTFGRATLEYQSCGAVVLDARTPGGETFLQLTQQQLPAVLWFVLLDVFDRAALAAWTRPGVTTLPLGVDGASLAIALRRSAQLQMWMAQPGIQSLLPHLRKLPVMPELHQQIIQELQSLDCSMEVIGQLISQDPVMTAKLLQVVNSAFFGLPYEIGAAGEAVMFLGSERARSLILLANVFSQFDKSRCFGFNPDDLWHHSVAVGSYARTIALIETQDGHLAETAFTAGLLHDVGKLLLAGNVPEFYATLLEREASGSPWRYEAEAELIGTTHAELGACILGTWGLPLALLEAIAWHHEPHLSSDPPFSLLTAVHAANALAHQNVGPEDAGAPSYPFDTALFSANGLLDRLPIWAERCGHPSGWKVSILEKLQP